MKRTKPTEHNAREGWVLGRVNHYKVHHEQAIGFNLLEWTEGDKHPHVLEGPFVYVEEALERLRFHHGEDVDATEVAQKLTL